MLYTSQDPQGGYNPVLYTSQDPSGRLYPGLYLSGPLREAIPWVYTSQVCTRQLYPGVIPFPFHCWPAPPPKRKQAKTLRMVDIPGFNLHLFLVIPGFEENERLRRPCAQGGRRRRELRGEGKRPKPLLW